MDEEQIQEALYDSQCLRADPPENALIDQQAAEEQDMSSYEQGFLEPEPGYLC